MSPEAPAFRFRPPAAAVTPALRWVLARAFGPEGQAVEEPPAEAALALATALSLAARIAARQSPDRLAGELGPPGAAEIRRQRALAAAQEMRLERALEAVDEIAADLRIPYAPLKGEALVLGGFAPEGGRFAADVDLLVPEAKLESLQRELVARGFQIAGQPYEHQAPLLRHRDGGAIELHRKIPGLRLAGKRSATFEDLAAAGLTGPLSPVAGRKPRADVRLPRREVLTAHALLHTLAQHAFAAAAPGFLMIADLQDLGFRGSAGRATLASIAPWIERDVGYEEATAALDLTTRLAAGDGALLENYAADERPPARRLADHFVAAATDPRYAEAMKLRIFDSVVSDRSPAAARAELLAKTLVPARERQRGEGWAHYFARLAIRPFELAKRWRRAKSADDELDS